MTKIHKNAPLPFQGQKRNFAARYKDVLLEINQQQKINTIVDLFGGSGLLSHIARQTLPDAQVIYNDFDDYHIRLKNIDSTNKLIAKIRAIVGKTKDSSKIDDDKKLQILEIVKQAECANGFVDYITLSASLLFSGKYIINFDQLQKQGFYNQIKQNNYPNANDYLIGIDVVKQDYKVLVERYKDKQGVLFVIDPPYLSTDTSTYSSDKYWKLCDYLDVLNVLKSNDYIYFTSNKSSIVELCEWMSKNGGVQNPFYGATVCTHQTTLNISSKYTDMMLYKMKS